MSHVFFSVTVGPDQTFIKEIPLLHQPQAMEIGVVRNLSPWFTGVPDIAVVGGLDSLELRLSKFDYTILMAVLAENFAEGNPTTGPPSSRSLVDMSPMMTPHASSLVPLVKLGESPVKPPPSTRLTKIKVAFVIGKISARLYLVELPDIHDQQQVPT